MTQLELPVAQLTASGLDRRRWRAARRAAHERDGFACRRCGKRGALECHHVTRLRDGGEPYELANLLTLCRSCHIRHTAGENTRRPIAGRDAWIERLREVEHGV